ncbi:flagellar export protein FliJ [Virgibacillus sp. MSJ-26]|uniref:flagellar export protein FliJ n=1 Tax=Virgibacillus sp. MSJ-26 TaxID=2841522 RepID=UPI001C11B9C5|nr:flagellar export protein FliJ [Virgibacillus sp. MSJ-26]MBU5466777.1 flagellar export protein FliJ [Virgibacillus sp. MSJ-26]
MSTVALGKVLTVREREKVDAQKAYNLSIKSFEDVATRLYTLLKKKEEAEETYEASFHESTSIDMIKQQVEYIENLSYKIASLQEQVQKARSEMEQQHGKLTAAHVEVKKFEKVIETRRKTEEEVEKRREEAFLDEISIQQYLSQVK